jgi:AAA+ superfamily predicted ATPase
MNEMTDRMRRFVDGDLKERWESEQRTIFYFYGPDGTGKRDLAEATATELGKPLLTCDTEKLLDGVVPFEESTWILGREALLQSAVLCMENVEVLQTEAGKQPRQITSLLDAVQTFSPATFLFGEKRWKPERLLTGTTFIEIGFPIPPTHVRKHLWFSNLNGDHRIAGDPELGALASKFRLTSGQIREAVVTARGLARWSESGDSGISLTDLHSACRLYSQQDLGTLARKIDPLYRWSDIVLPEDSLTQLHEMCGRVGQRQRVLSEWGFGSKLSLGTGISALFVGASGTGKTMAAEIIANELELDLYKIDLSGAVSKYIGETEKNLERIFTAAENANAILFFDEADALFGKRSEVRDSHDRYANIEVAYLLQRIEQYEGVAILSTNLRQNIDDAFLRRLQFIVDFPFPDEFHRKLIWQTLFSAEAPCAEEIDFDFLARLFRIAGGNIRNVVLGAAYLAASDDAQIGMSHFLQAARREYQKLGKVFPEVERFGYPGSREKIELIE